MHIALMRGLNVGRANRITMAALKEVFEAAGAKNVRTFIQSGNVLFEASAAVMKTLHDTVEHGLVAHGVKSPVILRTAGQLKAALEAMPFDGPTDQLHFGFLAGKPQTTIVESPSEHDRFKVIGREVYLQYPNGLGRSKLSSAWFDKTLGTMITVRNWNTVTRLVALAEEA